MAIGTTAAILGSAVIGAGAGLAGSAAQSRAASRSAQATTDAANQNNATQLQIYNQQRADAEPWRQFGLGALGQLASLYNINWQPPATMQGGQWQGPNTGTGAGQGTGSGAGGQLPAGSGGGFLQNWMNPGGQETPAVNPLQYGESALSGGDYRGQPLGPGAGVSGLNALAAVPANDQPQVNGGPNVQTMQTTGAQPTTGQPNTQPLNTAPFFASPDYQFRLNEGNRNLTNAFANTGNLDSGAAQRALLRYGQDTASGEWNNYVNRLASFSGIGQTVNAQNNALGQNYANAVGQNNWNAAQGRASAYQQQGQAWQQGLGTVAGAGMWAINNYPWGK